MWRNLYIEKNKCDCCNRSDKLHIGKSSYWREFTFRGHNRLEEERENHLNMSSIRSYNDLKKAIEKCKIIDEYGEYESKEDFMDQVEKKRSQKRHDYYNNTHRDNNDNYFSFNEFC